MCWRRQRIPVTSASVKVKEQWNEWLCDISIRVLELELEVEGEPKRSVDGPQIFVISLSVSPGHFKIDELVAG